MPAHRTAKSKDGTRLALHTAGRVDSPLVLLVHGWAQSAQCWHHQFEDEELTAELQLAAFDLRGHGSSVPATGPDGYGDSDTWADDVHAVLTELQPRGPAVLVGWSYGGLVIADYLSRHGTDAVAGVLLTGALTGMGRGEPAGRIGPVMRAALPDALSDDPAVATPALTAFVDGMGDLPREERAALLDAALRTPARVRAALFDRTVDGGRVTEALGTRPLLVQHGIQDPVVDRSTAEHHLRVISGAEADWWEGGGHAPFAEDPQRFAATLLAFVRRCGTARERMNR